MRQSKHLRVALAVPSLSNDRVANLAVIEDLTERASQAAVDVIVFPETTLTGFVHCEDPTVDQRLAVALAGPEVHRLSVLAQLCIQHVSGRTRKCPDGRASLKLQAGREP